MTTFKVVANVAVIMDFIDNLDFMQIKTLL